MMSKLNADYMLDHQFKLQEKKKEDSYQLNLFEEQLNEHNCKWKVKVET